MKLLCLWSLIVSASWSAEIPVPSRWLGEATGTVYGKPFELKIHIKIAKPVKGEKNPLNLFLSTSDITTSAEEMKIGEFALSSAIDFSYTNVQYMTVEVSGGNIKAVLTDDGYKKRLVRNFFSAPNVSLDKSSDLMREVHAAMGETETFRFTPGSTVTLQIKGDKLTGTLQARGSSAYNPIVNNLRFVCNFTATQTDEEDPGPMPDPN